MSLSLGYPLGAVTVKGVNLGATAGTLIVGIALSLTAFIAFGITYSAPVVHVFGNEVFPSAKDRLKAVNLKVFSLKSSSLSEGHLTVITKGKKP